jgi:hypothetical protein
VKPAHRNLLVWGVAAAIAAAIWFFAARPRLHFIDPTLFLLILAAAAAALTALLWWEIAGDDTPPTAAAPPPSTGDTP